MKPTTTKDENWRNRKVMLPNVQDLAVPRLTAGGISQYPFSAAAPRLPPGIKFAHQGVIFMNCSFFPPARAALLGAAFVGLTATAASAQVQSGVLQCNVAPGVGFIIGSSKTLSCVFHPVRGRPEYYAGTINRIGLDIGVTGPGRFAWSVVSAGPPGRRYALVGDYAGPGVGFALGAGGSANTLVG